MRSIILRQIRSFSSSFSRIQGEWNSNCDGRLQLTLCIVKPDATANPHVVKCIRDIILSHGFQVVKTKRSTLSSKEAQTFYIDHQGKFFYNRLVTFMSSGPCYAHILAHPDAITKWRWLMGPTKSFRAQHDEPESIRGRFGLTDTRNATHGSDSLDNAISDIKFFFPNFNMNDWYKNDEEHFRFKNVNFDDDKFEHRVKL